MLIMLIGWFIAGVIFIYRGNQTLQKALMCSDEAERIAMEALGKRNRRIGIIFISVTVAVALGFLILLGTL